MGFRCGIVGLPNVGKSTLFNALTRSQSAQAENYPFCTIEPNVGEVDVPDDRLGQLAGISGSARIVPARLGFVDIAGLVEGAAQGEGLGNRFLAAIREVDAIAHVVRCFEDSEVTHVAGQVDPPGDARMIETELLLADLASLERQIEGSRKKARSGDGDEKRHLKTLEALAAHIGDGQPARLFPAGDAREADTLRAAGLLTAKPQLYVMNVAEEALVSGDVLTRAFAEHCKASHTPFVMVSAAIEAEVAQLPPHEQGEYLQSLGLADTGLVRMIQAGYGLLELITFFTSGPKETRAWTIRKGTSAARAAGTIHSDFERGFIRAQTISCDDFVREGGEAGAREAGKARDEGRDYIVRDGDVMLFRFNV